MGEVVKLNFGVDGKILSREQYVSTTQGITFAYGLRSLKTAETATRQELSEQAANVMANLAIAKTSRHDVTEIKEFQIILRQCMDAFVPSASVGEKRKMGKAAKVIKGELQQDSDSATVNASPLYEVSELQEQDEHRNLIDEMEVS